jgi:hypothetical protein
MLRINIDRCSFKRIQYIIIKYTLSL